MKNTSLIRRYAFHNFKDEKAFEKFLRTQYHEHWKNDFKTYKKSLDAIAVKGILFTMEEYDHSGKTLVWGNKKKGKTLEVNTQDRYKNGYEDAKVEEIYESFGSRNDINYLE